MGWKKTSLLKREQQENTQCSNEPFEVYKDRFTGPSSPLRIKDAYRYVEEVLINLDGSLLVVGSGHGDHCNTFLTRCPNISITASDILIEARAHLDSKIHFICLDLLFEQFKNKFDYVISIHTLEHFTKIDLFNTVWPNLVNAANRAVITIVPYAMAWSDEPSHKCYFYEDDEFAVLQDRYKIIFGEQEIVYWKSII